MNTEYFNINDIPAKLYRAENSCGTVLAAHGFGGSKESCAVEMLAEKVCPKGLNVLAFDLPAHGKREGGAEQLDPRRCIADIMAAEQYITANFAGDIYAYATSFGAMCLLHRLEQAPDRFRRIVLRVPAVNMAESLLAISALRQPKLTPEAAQEHGFDIRIGREYHIPYRFYEMLKPLSCLRSSEHWNNRRILTIYAEKDELVASADTLQFLHCNPEINSLCIMGATHRAPLEEAVESAQRFICES